MVTFKLFSYGGLWPIQFAMGGSSTEPEIHDSVCQASQDEVLATGLQLIAALKDEGRSGDVSRGKSTEAMIKLKQTRARTDEIAEMYSAAVSRLVHRIP